MVLPMFGFALMLIVVGSLGSLVAYADQNVSQLNRAVCLAALLAGLTAFVFPFVCGFIFNYLFGHWAEGIVFFSGYLLGGAFGFCLGLWLSYRFRI